ncbi:MAG: response regulator transcription factor [Methylococcales bacterium]|nr:response regulator transcription factor [Methylococcales bacterium]
MTNLLIASKGQDTLHHWVQMLEPIYSLSISVDKNIDTLLDVREDNKDTLLVIEASLIDEMHSISQLCRLVNKVIVVGENFTAYQQIQLIFDGVSGYSDKSIDERLIPRAIEGVLNDEIWLERQLIPQVLKGVVTKQNTPKKTDNLFTDSEMFKSLEILTRREIEVVKHVYNGENNQTISDTLFISIRTVKAHLSAIFRKLNVQDRFQLVVYLKNLHVERLTH